MKVKYGSLTAISKADPGDVAPHGANMACPARDSLHQGELKSKRACAHCKVFTTQGQCKKAKACVFNASLIFSGTNKWIMDNYNKNIVFLPIVQTGTISLNRI